MFLIAALLTIVLLSVIANMIEDKIEKQPCQVHKWVTSTLETRNHYLVCEHCGQEPM
jgi:hypothetical protein